MAAVPVVDWVDWHRRYDDPTSSLTRRRTVVRRLFADALSEIPATRSRVISMCAGDGGDILAVLPAHSLAQALLVESDPRLARRSRASARQRRLQGVTVTIADAGNTLAYASAVPADVVLACGIFGNVTPEDVRRTIDALPSLLRAGGSVVWTRGRRGNDVTATIRSWFAESGFAERAFVAPADEDFSVGLHQLAAPPKPYSAGRRLFTFVK